MPKMTDDQLVTAIYNSLDANTAFSNSVLKQNRADAWNYYLGRKRGDEIEGRSQVQDSSVRDTVHAMLSQIMPAWSTDDPISFTTNGPGDHDQAAAESNAVNSVFTETNQGYMELYSAVHDCLLFRNGVIRVQVVDRTEVTHRSFQAPPADVIAGFTGGEIELVKTDKDGLSTFKITTETQELVCESIEPALLTIDYNQSDQQLDNSSFIAELTYLTRSELITMGISKKLVKELPATPDRATGDRSGSNVDLVAKFVEAGIDIHDQATRDQDQIACYWVHMQVDRDGDGVSEKYRFLVSDRKILLDDPVDFFPYASGVAFAVPHRWSGLSLYDILRCTQDQRTNALRQLNDNMNVANNQRPIYDPGETEAEDIANGAPGRGIRSRNPANVAFMPLQDITSNSISYLQYTDKMRSEQSGASLTLQGEGQVMKQISGISAEMQLQPQEQLAAMISRSIAETLVRNLFLLIHKTLIQDWRQPILYEKSGDWQETNPAEWQPRNRINMNVGLSPGERRRQSAALQYVHQMQLQLIQGGSANITANWNGLNASLQKWMQAVELDQTETFFLDPDGQESQQGQQAAQQQQQAEQQKQDQLMQMQIQMEQMSRQLEAQKVENERIDEEQTLRFKYWEQLLQADVKEQEIDQQADAAASKAAIGSNGTGGPGQRDSE